MCFYCSRTAGLAHGDALDADSLVGYQLIQPAINAPTLVAIGTGETRAPGTNQETQELENEVIEDVTVGGTQLPTDYAHEGVLDAIRRSLSSYGPVITALCHESMQGCSAQLAFNNLKKAPGPGGDGTPIKHGQVTNLFVGPTQHFIDEKTKTIYNVTREGHVLYPGTVTRQVVVKNGWVFMHTTKQGGFTLMGVLSKIPAQSLWRDVDLRVQKMMYLEAMGGK